MPKVSVIVPVYNVEKLLNRCIESILNQTYEDFELILVDDGSPDKCGEICDKFVEQDSRVKCIHKKNGGVSRARNIGLDIAKGRYICFVDSDDWIEPDLIEECVKYIELEGSDVVLFDWYVGPIEDRHYMHYNEQYTVSVEAVRNGVYWDEIPSMICNKFFVAELWKDIRYPVDVNFEDLAVMPDIFERVKNISYIKKALYNYTGENPNSITKSISSKADCGIHLAWKKRENIAIRNNDKELLEYSCRRALRNAVSGYGLSLVDHSLTAEQIKTMIDYCKERHDLIYGIDMGIRYKVSLFGVTNCKFLCWIYGSTKYFLYRMKKYFAKYRIVINVNY